jgi:O-acetyl-ADP-ribose deacetylase (regulator of RNase III)
LDEFQEFVDSEGEQKFGTVLLTKSGGGNSKHLLHVVSVASPREHEFDTVQTAFYNALKVAETNGIKRIVAPAMGTGIIGQLTAAQSAKAMMSAIEQYDTKIISRGGVPGGSASARTRTARFILSLRLRRIDSPMAAPDDEADLGTATAPERRL